MNNPETEAAPTTNPKSRHVELEEPIVRGEQRITAIDLRKPQSGDLRGIKLGELLQLDVSSIQTLLPRISSPFLTPADISALDPVDLVAIGGEIVSFFLSKEIRQSLPA